MLGSSVRRASLLFVSVALVASGTVAAEGRAGRIEGRVIDAATNRPISGATVRVSPSGASARSGGNGSFAIGGLAAGSYQVTCSKPGYRAEPSSRMKMSAGGTLRHTCKLRRIRNAPAPEPAKEEAAADGRGAPVVSGPRLTKSPALRRPVMIRPPHTPPPRDGDFNREGYEHRGENPFVGTADEPLSTFSIDVDTASYSNVRRFLEQGRLPPADAIKIEELINYFSYDDPDPKGNLPFSANTEISTAPWNSSHRLVRIGLQGRRLDTRKLPASNMVFLLDVSGSMHSADKLPLLKDSLAMLVNEMRPKDRVAIAVYAGAAGLVLPSTSGRHKDRILAALDNLQAGGSTAGAAGIELAYKVARENFIRGGNNRVILATDGDFNVGPSSDGELVRLIENKRKGGVFLTVLGFGTGNYQDAKMEKLADKGNGNHAYIDSLLEARKVLVSEMGGTLFTIAKDVKLQIEFNPGKVKAYRLIGYENRMLAARDFNDDKKDAGELGAGHSVTALYEIIPAGSKEKVVGVDELKYQRVQSTTAAGSGELMTVKLRYKAPDGDKSRLIVHVVKDSPRPLARTSKDFRFATAVAELGLLLRDSKHKANASWPALIARAEGALGSDRGGYRKAFLTLAGKAQRLAEKANIAR
jgi:Ca-activated chloride channel family protein